MDVVPGIARRRDRVLGLGGRNVAEGMPLPHHQTRADVDLLHHGVAQHPVARTARGGEVHAHRVVCVDPGGAFGRQLYRVQVGAVAVARAHRCELPVGAVVDDVFTLAEAQFENVPLPPHQGGTSLVLLHREVRRLDARRQRVEPHEVPALIGDHRSRSCPGPGRGRAADPPGGARPGRRRDRHRAGRERGSARRSAGPPRVSGSPAETLWRDRRLARDGEAAGDAPPAQVSRRHPSDDGHTLAGRERAASAGSSHRCRSNRRAARPCGPRSPNRSPAPAIRSCRWRPGS